MKKILLFTAVCICSLINSYAQCTIDPAITEPGIYPDTLTNLPPAFEGVSYQTVIQIRVLTDTTVSQGNVTVTNITVNSVTGMPAAFTYSCNPSGCVFPGGGNGCVLLFGTPAIGSAGTYIITINSTLNGKLFNVIPVSQAFTTNGYKIVIHPKPTPNFFASSTTVCQSGSVNFTDASSHLPSSWLWSFPGGTPATSTLQTPPAITYATSGTKNVTLTVSNPAGSNTITKTAYVNVIALPAAKITPSGTSTICPGSSILLSANTGAGLTYQWQKSNVNILNATAATYTASASGSYKVRVTNSAGCSKTSKAKTVSLYVVTATATPNGPTTFCTGGSVTFQANTSGIVAWQWLKGTNAIANAINSSYVATLGGIYKVKVTTTDGCTKTSSGITVTVNNCRNDESDNVITDGFEAGLFPNPTTALSTISLHLIKEENLNIKLLDVTGRFVLQIAEGRFKEGKHEFSVDASFLSNGIYFAIINTGDRTKSLKMIVNK